MKLTYRGTAYESNQPAVDVVEMGIEGKYRGATWQLVTLKKVPVPQVNYALKYRGVAYGNINLTSTSELINPEPVLFSD